MHIEEVEAIWSAIAERDDWRPFENKVAAIRRMGEAMAEDAARPGLTPQPSSWSAQLNGENTGVDRAGDWHRDLVGGDR